ncbi:MAG TPA: tRNA lysidine(34) synthetase TilS [Saprospiraceae bacterium]|nr:tRNA lysidine(34) synthetase TilS [Saprospiraceae bacterium]HPN70191.1 tRNA lysidine(34) synthetase TilS [Saprospiraceae bacterium]
MIQKFLHYLDREHLVNPGEKVLLAVSGGKDSMVMVDLFMKANLSFGIAHINHNTRGVSSDADEDFVRAFASKNEIPFFIMHLDPAISKSSNFQAKAREIRYEWLTNVMKKEGFQHIATAHHQNDNIESFLMGLLRSSGTRGLSGIAPKKENIIRPLLFASREEIDQYQIANNIGFREDESNASEKYLRNKIRHNVVKVLHHVDPQAVQKIDESIRIIAESNELLEYFVANDKSVVSTNGELKIVDIVALKKLPAPAAFLWYKLNDFGFTKSDIVDMLESMRSGASFSTATHKAVIDRSKIIIQPLHLFAEEEDKESIIHIEGPGNYPVDEHSSINVAIVDHLEFGKKSNEEYLGFQDQPMPLIIRKRKNGDAFKPLGMGGKSQKVKDFIVNNKLSFEDKNKLWLLTTHKDDEIVAVLPYRISEDYKVTPESKFILKLEINPTK